MRCAIRVVALAASYLLVIGTKTLASSPLCLAGCVKAEVRGIGELAGALRDWAELLPELNVQFHEQVRQDIQSMDIVARDLVDQLDRTYGKNLDLTNSAVRSLIDHAVLRINELGKSALASYRQAPVDTECTTVSLATIIRKNFEEVVPNFQWIRGLFGEKFNLLQTVDLTGNVIEVSFDPTSDTSRFAAAYELSTIKLESARDDTKLLSVLDIALERQKLAYSYHSQIQGQHWEC